MGDHDLREPGADGRGRAPGCLAAVAQVCARWELASPSSARSPTTGGSARSATTRSSARSPRACSPTSARATTLDREAPARRRRAGRDVLALRAEPRSRRTGSSAQYDQLVGSRTVRRPGLDAAVLRLRPSLRGLAVSLARAAARRARPVPRRAAGRARRGAERRVRRRRAARADRLPQLRQPGEARDRVGARAGDRGRSRRRRRRSGSRSSPGNVSLYNETDGRAIPPTPVVGCVGLVARRPLRPRRAGARATRSLARAPTS